MCHVYRSPLLVCMESDTDRYPRRGGGMKHRAGRLSRPVRHAVVCKKSGRFRWFVSNGTQQMNRSVEATVGEVGSVPGRRYRARVVCPLGLLQS